MKRATGFVRFESEGLLRLADEGLKLARGGRLRSGIYDEPSPCPALADNAGEGVKRM